MLTTTRSARFRSRRKAHRTRLGPSSSIAPIARSLRIAALATDPLSLCMDSQKYPLQYAYTNFLLLGSYE